MNLSTLIVALLGVAASTTVVNASSIPAPSRATASDWADVADEEWGNAGGEDLSDMQRRRLSTTAPSAAATTDTFYQGETPTPVAAGEGVPVPTTASVTQEITGLPAPSRRLSSSVQRDLAAVSCSSLDIDRDAYEAQLDTDYCDELEDDANIDTCEIKNLVLTCETEGPTASPTGITLTVDFDLYLVVGCTATPCDADAAEAAVTAATVEVAAISTNIATTAGTSIPTTAGSTITVAAADITITEEVTSNADDFSKWYPLSYVNVGEGNTCSNDGGYPGWLSTTFIKSSLKECCKGNYKWAENDCIVDGGGNPASLEGYGKFYIGDYDNDKQYCVKSCPKDTTGIENCDGIAETWEKAAGLYTTAEECCDKSPFYFGNGWSKDKCIYMSENGNLDNFVYVGTGMYFVPNQDWDGCYQDNAANEGLYQNEFTYSTQAKCCKDKFGWLDEDKEDDITGCCKGGIAGNVC